MKSRIESIVRVFLRKWVAKVDIGTFSVAILTTTARDALRLHRREESWKAKKISKLLLSWNWIQARWKRFAEADDRALMSFCQRSHF
jgi:hypothetical protein